MGELENMLYSADDMPTGLSGMYMPVDDLFIKIKKYWESVPHDTWFQKIGRIGSPLYHYWHVPSDFQEKVSFYLKQLIEVTAKIDPQITIVPGILYGVSQVVYGLKNKSGKHAGAGLVSLVENAKIYGDEKVKVIAAKLEDVFDHYFGNFNPELTS